MVNFFTWRKSKSPIYQCQTSKSFLSLFILPNLVLINSEATHKYIRMKTNENGHHCDSLWPYCYGPDPHQTISFGFPPSVRLNMESTLHEFYLVDNMQRFYIAILISRSRKYFIATRLSAGSRSANFATPDKQSAASEQTPKRTTN